MKIALLGYGKMGQTIEKIALSRGHEIVIKIDKDAESYDISGAEVAIDFSIPDAAVHNISNCLNHSVPIILGQPDGWNAMKRWKRFAVKRRVPFSMPPILVWVSTSFLS